MTSNPPPAATQLLPCPFCGSTRVHLMTVESVMCMEGDCDAANGSVDAWNRRTPAQAWIPCASDLLNRARAYVALHSGKQADELLCAIDAWQEQNMKPTGDER